MLSKMRKQTFHERYENLNYIKTKFNSPIQILFSDMLFHWQIPQISSKDSEKLFLSALWTKF